MGQLLGLRRHLPDQHQSGIDLAQVNAGIVLGRNQRSIINAITGEFRSEELNRDCRSWPAVVTGHGGRIQVVKAGKDTTRKLGGLSREPCGFASHECLPGFRGPQGGDAGG